MPNILSRSDFNIGQDVSVIIQSDRGDNFSAEELGILEDVDLDVARNTIKVPAITHRGRTLKMSTPSGYTLKMKFARQNKQLASLHLAVDKRWREQKLSTTFSIQISVQNRDGSVSNYLCKEFAIGNGKILSAKQDKAIDQDVMFEGAEVIET